MNRTIGRPGLPIWKCSGSEDDFGDEWEDVRASDAQDAAEVFCEHYNARNAEYPSESTVRVKLPSGQVETYTVTLEAVPYYTARRQP